MSKGEGNAKSFSTEFNPPHRPRLIPSFERNDYPEILKLIGESERRPASYDEWVDLIQASMGPHSIECGKRALA